MATKTSLLGLTKPAYTEAADIAVLNTNFDLIDKALGNGARVDNLIINGDFLNPVNHNGFTRTTGNGVKIIDMWVAESFDSGCVISLSSEGITLDCSAKIGGITYKFRNYNMLKGRTVTCAVCVNGAWECGSFKLGSNGVGIKINSLSVFSTGEHELLLRYNAPGMSITIQRVALYEGTYTADTLPAYVVPDKRIEMIRCDVPMNPPNLLVNSWFVNPVNYQGRTGTYEGVANYTTFVLDQWKTWSTGCSYTITSTGLQISNKNTSSAAGPWEVLPNPERMKGKTYTLAVGYGGGNVVCGSATVPSGSVTADKYVTAVSAAGTTPGLRLVIYAEDQRVEFQILVVAGQTVTVEWAALYEGVYDADTLPEYVVPNKRIEMTRCDVPLNPPNLLDNSHFAAARFIAQAGLDEYHGSVAYLGDRWRSHVSITATAQTNGLLLDSVAQHAYIYQKVQLQKGKTYTYAVRASGVTAAHRIAVYNDGLGIFVKEAHSTSEGTLVASFTAAYDKMAMLYYPGYASDGGSSVIEWAALYEGAYDADTLPEYHYKGYAAELAECQRYYRQSYTGNCSAYGCLSFIAPTIGQSVPAVHWDMGMRTAPTVTIKSWGDIKENAVRDWSEGKDIAINGVAYPDVHGFSVNTYKDGSLVLTPGKIYAFHYTASADL